MTPGFDFELVAGDPHGPRCGRFSTPHGVVETPAFMPVGTHGSVKGVAPELLRDIGASIVLANAFHLEDRPGSATVERIGGLHRFTGWDGPILTDSGGFQVFSLADLRTFDDDGVEFRSPVDGRPLRLTPERTLDIQAALGTDVAMVLDDCTRGGIGRDEAASSLARTLRWAERAAEHRSRWNLRRPPAVFGITQGGSHEDLRLEAAQKLRALDFDGYAVGGISVGEEREQMLATIAHGTAGLPPDRPRYLMGVGGLEEFLRSVAAGFDLFDCVLPTRNARNGFLFRRRGEPVRIRNERYREDPGPIEEGCDCLTCRRYCRGFINHLLRRRELLGYTLASVHNLRVFLRFLEDARAAIAAGRWGEFESAEAWTAR